MFTAADTLPGFPGFTCTAVGITETVAEWMAEHDNHVTLSQIVDEEQGLSASYEEVTEAFAENTTQLEKRDTEDSDDGSEPVNVVDEMPRTMMMPDSLLESIKKGDSAAFYSARAAAASDIDAVYRQMKDYGEQALQEWTSSTGQVVWASSAASATFYSFAQEVKEKDADGKENVKQIVQIGTYSGSTGMTTRLDWKIAKSAAKAAAGFVAGKLAWSFAKWFVDVVAKKIADTAAWGVLVGILQGGGYLTPTVKTVLRYGGKTVSFISRSFFTGIAAFLATWAVDSLMTYLGTNYCLMLDIMNLSDKVDWEVSEEDGDNEEISEGKWKISTIPKKQHDNNSIVGFTGGTVSKATVYYATYIFTQNAPLFGGFTMATTLVPSDNSEGAIVKYRVEKAADNSMGVAMLKAGDKSAKSNYDHVHMKKEKVVSIDHPSVKLLADQLWNSTDDIYKCTVFLG